MSRRKSLLNRYKSYCRSLKKTSKGINGSTTKRKMSDLWLYKNYYRNIHLNGAVLFNTHYISKKKNRFYKSKVFLILWISSCFFILPKSTVLWEIWSYRERLRNRFVVTPQVLCSLAQTVQKWIMYISVRNSVVPSHYYQPKKLLTVKYICNKFDIFIYRNAMQ